MHGRKFSVNEILTLNLTWNILDTPAGTTTLLRLISSMFVCVCVCVRMRARPNVDPFRIFVVCTPVCGEKR